MGNKEEGVKTVIKLFVAALAIAGVVVAVNSDYIQGVLKPIDAADMQTRVQVFIDESKKIHTADLHKNPDTYKGEKVAFYGKVLEAEKGALSSNTKYIITVSIDVEENRRRARDNPNDHTLVWNYSDVIEVSYDASSDDVVIESGDTVQVYGIFKSIGSYKKKDGTVIRLPNIDGKYVSVQ